MKKILLFILFIATNGLYAQLFIGSSQYVYVKNEVIYVTQDVNLSAGTNFYLRNEAQLVQGTAVNSANKGAGTLSVFQEGNSDNYEYNYWCSPVGNASAATGNEDFGLTMVGRPSSVTGFTPALFTSSPDGYSTPLTISAKWIFKYLSSSTSSGWINAGYSSTIVAGQGFTMKGTSGTDNVVVEGNGIQNNSGSAQRYDFRGKPNDGNITVNIAAGSFTLTGNPYPSALHLNAFLLDPGNTAGTAIAYFYEQDKNVNSHVFLAYKGGYGTYSPVSLGSSGIYVPPTFDTYNADGSVNTVGTTSGTAMARKYSPVGQGFMVEGASSGTLTLKNSHRAYYKESTLSNSYFNRNAQNAQKDAIHSNETQNDSIELPIAQIRINTSVNDTYTRQIVLALIPDATDGVDRGIDARGTDDLANDISFLLENEKYVIQGITFDINKRLPLSVKATGNAVFSIGVAEFVNFDPEQPVYIYDAFDGSYHAIHNTNYTFQLNEGIYENRFEITFDNTQLSIPAQQLSDLIIVQDNNNKLLKISNPNGRNLTLVTGFDILGRQVFQDKWNGAATVYERSTSGLSTGVYLIKINATGNEVTTKKIIVK